MDGCMLYLVISKKKKLQNAITLFSKEKGSGYAQKAGRKKGLTTTLAQGPR